MMAIDTTTRHATKLRGKIGNKVVQGCLPGLGNADWSPDRSVMVRTHSVPSTPPTARQIWWRLHHRAGTQTWKGMEPAEKISWQEKGKATAQTGYTAFLSYWLRQASISGGSVWDNGLSCWDDGLSTWDVAHTGTLPLSTWDDGLSCWDEGLSHWDNP